MKILKFLDKEVNGLHQAAFFLAFASIGAKVLAVLRDRLLASSFGAGEMLDVYYASFRVPDIIYVFTLFIVSTTALIPIFLGKKDKKGEARVFINSIFTVFFIAIIILLAFSYFLIPFVVDVIAPGFSEENTNTLIDLSRVLLLSPLFLGISNLVSSVIQSYRRFLAYALSGVVYNAGIIVGVVFLYPKMGILGVAWGVVFGALFHFLIQVPSIIQLGYFPVFSFSFLRKEILFDIKRVIKLSFPRTLGLTLNQLVLVVITSLASFLAAGSIAIFNLASNLQAIPLGVIALSYSVAAFPSLAKSFLRKDIKKFVSSVVSSLRHILFWLLPASVLFIVLRAQVVRVVLGAGEFSWADTRLTAAALALFAVSLFAQGLILLLVRAFYASGETKIPLFVNIFSSLIIVIFSFGLVYIFKSFVFVQTFFDRMLRVEDVSGTTILALALAFSLGTIINFLILFLFFEKKFGNILPHIKKSVCQILFVSILIGIVAYLGLIVFDDFFNLDTFWGIFLQGLLSGIIAIACGFILLKILKNKEFEEISESLKKKFFSKPASGPEVEDLL